VTDLRVDLLRRSYEGFAAMDADAVKAVWHPDCEWHMGPMILPEPVFHGHEGIDEFMAIVAETAETIDARMLETRVLGAHLLIRGFNTFRMRRHDVDMTNQPFGQVCEFKDGLIFRITQTDDPPPGWEDGEPVE
jgi:ketosteroid isomerase-like protein